MISKEKLKENVAKTKNTTKEALTTIYLPVNISKAENIYERNFQNEIHKK